MALAPLLAGATSQCWWKGLNRVPLETPFAKPAQGATGLRAALQELRQLSAHPDDQFVVDSSADFVCGTGIPIDPVDAAAYAGEHCLGERPIWVINLHGWTDEPIVDATPEGITLPRTLLFQTRAQYSVFREEPLNMKGPLVKSTVSPIITMGWCTAAPTLIGFFNGVANTADDADRSVRRLRESFGELRNGVPLQYHNFYNQTGCDRGATRFSCLEDIYEAYVQRDHELSGELSNRFELFWEALTERLHQEDSIGEALERQLTGNPLLEFGRWMASTLQFVANKLGVIALSMAGNPPTQQDMARQLDELREFDDQGTGAVLVAHSQGNLFLNSAYDGFKADRDVSRLRVVHVAPASPTLRGPYVLSDTDIVIDLLRRTSFGAGPAPNVQVTKSPADPTGHSFVDTYMDATRPAYRQIQELIVKDLDEL